MRGTKLIVMFAVGFLLFSFYHVKPQSLVVASAANNSNLIPEGALVVPDNYSTIQEAINNASAGDTVFVKKGTYTVIGYDGVLIDKQISLIGEDPQATVITAGQYRYGHDVLRITADNVTVSGFTIIGGGIGGIDVEDSYSHVPIGCKIIGNNIRDSDWGIITYGSTRTLTGFVQYKPSYLTITDNNITGNRVGLGIGSSNTIISRNSITNNSGRGITVDDSLYVTITGNDISNNGINRQPDDNDTGGLSLGWYGPFYVYGNTINNNVGNGISFGDFCNNSTIWGNSIANNDIGIQEYNVEDGGKGNIVYHNNIVGNGQQVAVNATRYSGAKPTFGPYTTDIVALDNGEVGNYWGDYRTKYPNAREIGSSGVGDTPYVVDESNVDHYPLMEQVEISVTAPPATPGTTPATKPTSPTEPAAGISPITVALIVLVVILGLGLVVSLLFLRSYRKNKPP